jgi:hypothetical protein
MDMKYYCKYGQWGDLSNFDEDKQIEQNWTEEGNETKMASQSVAVQAHAGLD